MARNDDTEEGKWKRPKEREVRGLKNYVKAVLYGYPLLENVSEDYEVHIQNKAVLSYRSDKSAWELAESLAGEICEKRDLEWLKGCVETALSALSDVEKTLIEARYFGKGRKKIKEAFCGNGQAKTGVAAWGERKYFRFQKRVSEKMSAILHRLGLTEELFQKKYAKTDIFNKIYRFVCEGRDRKIAQRAQRWIKE